MREVQVSVSAVSGIGNQKFRSLCSGLWLRTKPVLIRHPDSGSTFPGRPVREFSNTGAECGNFYIAATVTAGDADLYLDSNKNIEYHIYLYYCSHSVGFSKLLYSIVFISLTLNLYSMFS